MTVKELIEELERYPEDTRVFIGRMEEDDRENYDYTEYELEKDDIKTTGVYH
jgi:hypothetical protein